MFVFIRRTWAAYWNSRPHPMRKFHQAYTIQSLRKQGLSNSEIIQQLEK